MLPEEKKRKMRFNVLAMLRESGMPAPSEKDEIDEAELLADAEEGNGKEEGTESEGNGEETAVPPAGVNGLNLRQRKRKQLASL